MSYMTEWVRRRERLRHGETAKAEVDGIFSENPEEPDTREKLEADVRKMVAYSTSTLMSPPSANKVTEMLPSISVDTVIGWLDRQAAITERELNALLEEHGVHIVNDGLRHFTTVEFERGECTRCANDMGMYVDSLCDPLKREIAELQYERAILENDAEIIRDIANGLYRDLKAADPEKAAVWAKAWPDVFGEFDRNNEEGSLASTIAELQAKVDEQEKMLADSRELFSGMRKQRDEVLDENARLRTCMESDKEQHYEILAENAALEAELKLARGELKQMLNNHAQCGGALHEGMSENMWFELFGTPERVVRTLERMEVGDMEWHMLFMDDCGKCPLKRSLDRYEDCLPRMPLLEWLRGDAE